MPKIMNFFFQMVKNTSRIELAKSKSWDPESGSDEDQEIEPQLEQPVPEPSKFEFADNDPGELYILSEGLADIPDESVVDTESSDGHVGLHLDDLSDGDHKKDKDYVMDSDDGDDTSDKLDPDDEEFELRSVNETTKKPSAVKFKESSYFYPCLFDNNAENLH